jgi:low temperature requirement protein LtrA
VIPLELFIHLAYAFAATQVTAYTTHEHSLHGLIRGLLLLALLWETWAGYTWLALATLLTWLPKRAVRHDLAVPGVCAARLAS